MNPTPSSRVRCLVRALVAILFLAHAAPAAAARLTPQEERGRQIYFTGKGSTGEPILAWFGESLLEMPGETALCSGCHGYDGLGRPESGVIPTNVTWAYLTKAYGHVHPNGAEHPPFTDESLAYYMATGIYPGGATGDPSMPVYQMAGRDMEDLIAFLKRLGEQTDPGVTDAAIRVGTVVAAEGPLASLGAAARGVLEAYFHEVNRLGGIYGRALELVTLELVPSATPPGPHAATWLAEVRPFALVGTYTPGDDLAVQGAAADRDTPLVGPLTFWAVEDFNARRNLFFVLPGLSEQLQALLQHWGATEKPPSPRVALLHPDAPEAEAVAERLDWACRSRGWPALLREAYPPAAPDMAARAEKLRAAGAETVALLGNEPAIRGFLEAAAGRGWYPTVLAPGVLAGRLVVDAPPGFSRKLLLAYPTRSGDRKDWAVSELSRLAATHGLPPEHLQTMMSAYSSARVMVEGLRLAGRRLSRSRLIDVLQNLQQFETGFTPPLTYGPNRRVGARGAYVVVFVPPGEQGDEARPDPAWVEIE